MRKILFILLVLFAINRGTAQENLTEDVNSPIYRILELAETRGLIKNLPQVRPYSRKLILSYLVELRDSRAGLSDSELLIIASEIARLERSSKLAEPGSFLTTGAFVISRNEVFPTQLSLGLEGRLNLEPSAVPRAVDTLNFLSLGIEGNITRNFSYRVGVGSGLSYANANAFAPYTYTKGWDGKTLSFTNDSSIADFNSQNSLALPFIIQTESNLSLWADRISIGMNYYRRDFGISANSGLSLSKTARPFIGLDIRFRPVDWISLNYTVGGLSGFFENTSAKANFTIQQVELFPLKWLYFNITSSAIWVNRLAPLYMVPLLPVVFAQSLSGDYDNIALEFNIAFKLKYLKLYGSFFADEIQPQDFARLFSSVRQQFAIQAGLEVPVPLLPFMNIGFQFTKIEPYTYTHYAQRSPLEAANSRGSINISWMNDGENLGYGIPPNSMEFLFKINASPIVGLHLSLGYQFLIHGDGNSDNGQIEGSTDSVFNKTYNKPKPGTEDSSTVNTDQIYAGIYDPANYFNNEDIAKNFLYDGAYEYIHTISLEAQYRFSNFPLNLRASVDFSYNDGPVDNGVKSAATTSIAFGLGFTLYR